MMIRSTTLMCVTAMMFGCSDSATKLNNNEPAPDGGENNVANDMGGDVSSADMGRDSSNPNNTNPDMSPPPDLPDGPTSFALAVDCNDSVDAVYNTPVSDGMPGEVLACAVSESAGVTDVELRLFGIDGLQVLTGYQSYLIAYRTTRAGGEAGVASMLLYVPETNVRGVQTSGLVVVNHGLAAVPDTCAPSRGAQANSGLNSVALPFVGEGYPVALPDYAGLGTAGVMSFANTHDLGQSSLDAARAARSALVFGALNGDVLAVGQGEGGQASYAMQALNTEYAPDVNVTGAIGLAAAYPRVSYAELLRLGGIFPLVDGLGLARAVAATVVYTDFYNLFGEARARDGFQAALQGYVGDAVEQQCFVDLLVTLATTTANYTPPNTIGQLVDDTFRIDVVDCLNTGTCTADAQAFVDRTAANVKPLDPAGGDVLLISAFGGTTPNPQEQSCLLDWLAANGPAPVGCLWSGANNIDLSRKAASFIVDWGAATLEGQAAPTCPQNDFPPCQ